MSPVDSDALRAAALDGNFSAIDPRKLNELDDDTLRQIEDRLLLNEEGDAAALWRGLSGKCWIALFTLLIWYALQWLNTAFNIGRQLQQAWPVAFALYLIGLFGGLLAAGLIWRALGMRFRFGLRTLALHWPALMYAAVTLPALLR